MLRTHTQSIHSESDQIVHLQLRYQDDDDEQEEDVVHTDPSELDHVDNDDSDDATVTVSDDEEEDVDNTTDDSDDASVTDVTSLFLLHLILLVAAGGIEEEDVNTDYSDGDKVDAHGGVSDDDDEEEDVVDTDSSELDDVDTDDSDDGTVSDEEEDDDDTDDSDDGSISDVTSLFLLHITLVATGVIRVDDEREDMYDGLYELFLEPDDDEGEDDGDMYVGLFELFYEPDYMDEVLIRFGEIREQYADDVIWFCVGGCKVTHEMLREKLRIRCTEYRENIMKLASEYERMYG